MGGCVSNPSSTESSSFSGRNGPGDIPLEPTVHRPSIQRDASNRPSSITLNQQAQQDDKSPNSRSVFLPSNSISKARTLKPPPDTMSKRPILDALRKYATVSSPTKSIPPNVLLFSNQQCLVIFDAYPKAKYHFLVLPRYPFPGQSDLDSRESIVKLDQLDDLKSLLIRAKRGTRDQVLHAMMDTAREVEEMIRDEMVKTEGFEWKIDIGFHAVPSMKHLHLHVISEDRISPSMKTKKHHNSFRPDLGFFINIMEIERWLQQDEEFITEHVASLSGAESLLDSTLTCFKCDEPFHNMPKLKAHLEKEWAKEKKQALERIKRTGRQRSSDEDDLF